MSKYRRFSVTKSEGDTIKIALWKLKPSIQALITEFGETSEASTEWKYELQKIEDLERRLEAYNWYK